MSIDPERLTRLYHATGNLAPQTIAAFRQAIYARYQANPREMPWRATADPYRILVSEIMLQQTRVERVLTKYGQFLAAFPTIPDLAAAPLAELLRVWQGLGYNRRAIALKRCAEQIMASHGGRLPDSISGLESLPGIGPYTARAVAAFAYGKAEPLIETNIRTVFIHLFFLGQEGIADSRLMPLVAATLDRGNPREWYYALMDYGVMLKQLHPNPSRRSSHHSRQSPFKGSNRELRSAMLRTILDQPGITPARLSRQLASPAETVLKNLAALEREGFIDRAGRRFRICG
jgi:A/G-specific adenine glycosylase